MYCWSTRTSWNSWLFWRSYYWRYWRNRANSWAGLKMLSSWYSWFTGGNCRLFRRANYCKCRFWRSRWAGLDRDWWIAFRIFVFKLCKTIWHMKRKLICSSIFWFFFVCAFSFACVLLVVTFRSAWFLWTLCFVWLFLLFRTHFLFLLSALLYFACFRPASFSFHLFFSKCCREQVLRYTFWFLLQIFKKFAIGFVRKIW